MFCHRPWFRLAGVALLLLIAGLVFPGTVQARPSGEELPSLGAEPARIVDDLWRWIADLLSEHQAAGDHFVNLSGEEGWGMDPNGGKAVVNGTSPQAADSLP